MNNHQRLGSFNDASTSMRLENTPDGEKSPRQSSTEIASASPPPERPPPPKENMYAWLQVLGAFCLNLNTWYAFLEARIAMADGCWIGDMPYHQPVHMLRTAF